MAIWQKKENSQKSLECTILVRNWISKKYVPLDILKMCSFCFGLPRNDFTKDVKKQPEKSYIQSFPGSPK